MTRDKNRDRIRAARAPNGTNGPRFANGAGNFTVTFRFAGGDFPQCVPNAFLKFRPRQIQRRKTFRRTSGENIFQCGSGCAMPSNNFRGRDALLCVLAERQFGPTVGGKIQFSQSFFRIAGDKLTGARGDRQFDPSRFHSQPVSDCGQRPESGRATKKTARRRKR